MKLSNIADETIIIVQVIFAQSLQIFEAVEKHRAKWGWRSEAGEVRLAK